MNDQASPVQHTYSLSDIRQIPIFFVAAKGRSGTTLLQNMLDCNSHLVGPPESKFVLFLSKYGLGRKFVPGDEKTLISLLKFDRKIMANWHLDLERLEKNMGALIAEGAGFEDLCKLVYLSYPSGMLKDRIMFISDKNPAYGLDLMFLIKIFPQAKIIHLVRDYHDCIASNYSRFKKMPVGIISHAWNNINRKIELFKAKYPERSTTIYYEDLCNDPRPVMQKLCDFIGIQMEEEMFKFNERIVKYKDLVRWESLQKTHKDLLNPVSNKNIGKYKKSLTEKQIALIEYICAEDGKKYGHERALAPKKTLGMRINSTYCLMRYRRQRRLIRMYYSMPYFFRKRLHYMSNWLYKKAGYSNYYNHAEMLLKDRAAY